MRRLAHFAVGVGAASCLPFALPAGLSGNPLYLLLGGCCGLLPDVLETSGQRRFGRHDVTIAPDPLQPDPRLIADGIGNVIRHVDTTRRPLTFHLSPCRLGADCWHAYRVRFDLAKKRVVVRYEGTVDNTGERIAANGACGPPAVAPLDCATRLDSRATALVTSGPGMGLRAAPHPGGGVRLACCPLRRAWTHGWSAVVAVVALAAGLWGVRAGLAAACGWATHIAVDRLDHDAANPGLPFTRQRRYGLRWLGADNTLLNLATCWGACMLIAWNAGRAVNATLFDNPLRLLFVGLLLPLSGYRILRRFTRGAPS